MLLHSLKLKNFGLYAGEQTLQLAPRRFSKPRPIVLIGGKNGAGKTSILDAVRLVLYGKLAFGQRISQVEYDDYLRQRIHHGPAPNEVPETSITLEFDFVEAGDSQRYAVSRSWSSRGRSVVETLEVEKNGKPITSVPREEWHNFLQELLPPGVSQLFFFDGEKITNIAEDTDDNAHLAAAIRSLLGIDVIERLRTDLGLYIARHEGSATQTQEKRLDEVIRDYDRRGREIVDINEDLADLSTRLDGQRRAAERAKQRFVSAGGEVAIKRASLVSEREALSSKLDELRLTLREGSAGLWPLVVAPKLLRRALLALKAAQNRELKSATQHVQGAFETWHANASSTVRKRWTAKHIEEINGLFRSLLGEGDDPEADRSLGSIPGIEKRLETALERDLALSHTFMKEFDAAIYRVSEIDTALARVDETTTDYLFDELRAAEQACGATQGQMDTLRGTLKELHYQKVVLERERRRVLEELADAARSGRKTELAARAARVLSEYEVALVQRKVKELERAFVACFKRLARKGDLIAQIRIDVNSFQAQLFDASGSEVSKQHLSAGEKQIFAIAMLWALSKTSGRSLPVIIDTPLARLDSDHRAALVTRYFPEVSHQTILLSTDTEIDEPSLIRIEPFVSHTYRLEYQPHEGRTVVEPGYFGDTVGEGRRALQQA